MEDRKLSSNSSDIETSEIYLERVNSELDLIANQLIDGFFVFIKEYKMTIIGDDKILEVAIAESFYRKPLLQLKDQISKLEDDNTEKEVKKIIEICKSNTTYDAKLRENVNYYVNKILPKKMKVEEERKTYFRIEFNLLLSSLESILTYKKIIKKYKEHKEKIEESIKLNDSTKLYKDFEKNVFDKNLKTSNIEFPKKLKPGDSFPIFIKDCSAKLEAIGNQLEFIKIGEKIRSELIEKNYEQIEETRKKLRSFPDKQSTKKAKTTNQEPVMIEDSSLPSSSLTKEEEPVTIEDSSLPSSSLIKEEPVTIEDSSLPSSSLTKEESLKSTSEKQNKKYEYLFNTKKVDTKAKRKKNSKQEKKFPTLSSNYETSSQEIIQKREEKSSQQVADITESNKAITEENIQKNKEKINQLHIDNIVSVEDESKKVLTQKEESKSNEISSQENKEEKLSQTKVNIEAKSDKTSSGITQMDEESSSTIVVETEKHPTKEKAQVMVDDKPNVSIGVEPQNPLIKENSKKEEILNLDLPNKATGKWLTIAPKNTDEKIKSGKWVIELKTDEKNWKLSEKKFLDIKNELLPTVDFTNVEDLKQHPESLTAEYYKENEKIVICFYNSDCKDLKTMIDHYKYLKNSGILALSDNPNIQYKENTEDGEGGRVLYTNENITAIDDKTTILYNQKVNELVSHLKWAEKKSLKTLFASKQVIDASIRILNVIRDSQKSKESVEEKIAKLNKTLAAEKDNLKSMNKLHLLRGNTLKTIKLGLHNNTSLLFKSRALLRNNEDKVVDADAKEFEKLKRNYKNYKKIAKIFITRYELTTVENKYPSLLDLTKDELSKFKVDPEKNLQENMDLLEKLKENLISINNTIGYFDSLKGHDSDIKILLNNLLKELDFASEKMELSENKGPKPQ